MRPQLSLFKFRFKVLVQTPALFFHGPEAQIADIEDRVNRLQKFITENIEG